MARSRRRRADLPVDLAVRAVFGLALALPYCVRLRFMGWFVSRVLAPVAGWRKRIRDNLDHVLPDLPAEDRRRLERSVPENVGRTLIEIYSGREFFDHVATMPIEGPGLPVVEEAHRKGKPVIFVTGHFGNFTAARVALLSRGYPVGGLYRPMRNRHFNRHYVRALSAIGEPLFPSTRDGLGHLLRYLKTGGMVAFLIDIWAKDGEPLSFFGEPAPTALSAAQLALRNKAPLIPVYSVRQPDGLSFRTTFEAPVPHTDATTMTQALNDSLECQVRRHMDQWFWIHRRWKPERQRTDAAAKIGP